MNDETQAQPIQASFRSVMNDVKSFARRDPVQAVGIAFGAGLLINLLPTRIVANSAAAIGATLLRPTLLALGVIKAAELCCQKSNTNTPSL